MTLPSLNSYVQEAVRPRGAGAEIDPTVKPPARHTSQTWYNATHNRPWNARMPEVSRINSMEDVRATPGLAHLAPSYGNALERNTGYTVGSMLRPFFNHGTLDSAWGGGPLSAALMTGLPLAALGAGGAWLWNRFSDRQVPVGGAAAAAGGLGALLGGYAGYNRKHASAWRESGVDVGAMERAVKSDFSLSTDQKSQAVSALRQLDAGMLEQLFKFLQTSAGAGIGALIFRFLLGKGLVKTALGAMVGALVSRPRASTNAFGQSTLGGSRFYS